LSCFLKSSRSWLARMFSGSAFHAAGRACEKVRSLSTVIPEPCQPYKLLGKHTTALESEQLWTVFANGTLRTGCKWTRL